MLSEPAYGRKPLAELQTATQSILITKEGKGAHGQVCLRKRHCYVNSWMKMAPCGRPDALRCVCLSLRNNINNLKSVMQYAVNWRKLGWALSQHQYLSPKCV